MKYHQLGSYVATHDAKEKFSFVEAYTSTANCSPLLTRSITLYDRRSKLKIVGEVKIV